MDRYLKCRVIFFTSCLVLVLLPSKISFNEFFKTFDQFREVREQIEWYQSIVEVTVYQYHATDRPHVPSCGCHVDPNLGNFPSANLNRRYFRIYLIHSLSRSRSLPSWCIIIYRFVYLYNIGIWMLIDWWNFGSMVPWMALVPRIFRFRHFEDLIIGALACNICSPAAEFRDDLQSQTGLFLILLLLLLLSDQKPQFLLSFRSNWFPSEASRWSTVRS